jgi:hypothetical protein
MIGPGGSGGGERQLLALVHRVEVALTDARAQGVLVAGQGHLVERNFVERTREGNLRLLSRLETLIGA